MKNNVIRMFLAVSAASGMATALHAQTPDFSAKLIFYSLRWKIAVTY